MMTLDLNPNVSKTPPDPRNIRPGQVRRYGRKSNKEGRAQKSLDDQCACTLVTCKQFGLPTSNSDWMPEPIGAKGNEFWLGGGLNGLEEPDENRKTRPVLTQLLHDVRDGKVRAIVCFNLDRLFRDVEIAKSLLTFLFKHDCLLYDYDGPCNIWTHQGRNAILQNAIGSQALSENSRVNSPRGVRENLKMNKLVVSPNVLGFRSAGKRTGEVLHIAEEQALVNRIYEMCDGGMSTQQIADMLMAEGTRLYVATGGKNPHGAARTEANKHRIYVGTIRDILRDVRYVAQQKWNGDIYPCPAFLRKVERDGEIVEVTVVPVDLWQRVQVKLDEKRRTGNRSVNQRTFAGLIRCGLDGRGLNAQEVKQKNGARPVYWIMKGRNCNRPALKNCLDGLDLQCKHSLPSFRDDVLNEYVDSVFAPLLAAEVADRQQEGDGKALASERARLEIAIDEAELYLREGLAQFAISTVITPSLLGQMEREAIGRLDKLRSDLARVLAEEGALKDAPKLLADIRSLDPGLRRDLLRKLIVWIAVMPTSGEREPKPGYKCEGYTFAPGLVGKLVFLTVYGTYHTAEIRRERCPGHRGALPFTLRPASIEESIGSIADFPEPQSFYGGLKNSWEGRVYHWSPDKFGPGLFPAASSSVRLAAKQEELPLAA